MKQWRKELLFWSCSLGGRGSQLSKKSKPRAALKDREKAQDARKGWAVIFFAGREKKGVREAGFARGQRKKRVFEGYRKGKIRPRSQKGIRRPPTKRGARVLPWNRSKDKRKGTDDL